MAFKKRWESLSSGDYAAAANWAAISVRNASYSWTASGSGTNEYYLRTVGGTDPGFAAQPGTVQINGADAVEGTVGSLTAGQWDYGDNDTLGYSTIYVRLSGGGDPDSQALDHVTFRQIPKTSDDVRIPAGTASISSNLDQSAVTIGDFIVEEGYEGDIGTSTAYLRVVCGRCELNPTGGTQYLDVRSSNIPVQVLGTGTATTGERALYLLGSNITTLNVVQGDVGVAVRHGETATIATVRLGSTFASVWLGEGVTLTTYQQQAGIGRIRCGSTITTVLVYEGELTTEEEVVITTFNQKGGTAILNSTGTVTTLNIYDGILDLQKSGAARTISTLNKYRGNWQIYRNKEAVTITTETVQDTYVESATAS